MKIQLCLGHFKLLQFFGIRLAGTAILKHKVLLTLDKNNIPPTLGTLFNYNSQMKTVYIYR